MKFFKRNIYVIAGAFFVAVICVLYFLQNNPRDEDEPIAGDEERIVIYDSAADNSAGVSATPAPPLITVYISGEVVSPGVYEISSDARVERVVELAGGLTDEADASRINLAAHVADAQHIVVPAVGGPVVSAGTAADGAYPEQSALVNINTASTDELQTLPGIGEAIAGYIVEYREEHGGFKSIDEIMNVTRIGAVTFDRIKDKITV
jgi:competence protein ComEA